MTRGSVKQSSKVGFSIAGAALVIWIFWSCLGLFLTALDYKWGFQELGQWADSFGALNTLFGAFGFSAVIWSLWVQREQNRSAEADQHKQRFDSTYFEMLKLLRETRKDIRFKHSSEYQTDKGHTNRDTLEGLQALRQAWEEAVHFIEKPGFVVSSNSVEGIYTKYIHDRFESNFGPYFRLMYTILHRVETDNFLSDDEKHKYGNLLRSQLNSYELAMVGLNGLSPVSKDFGQLIIKFHLLKYLPPGSRRSILTACYPPAAFTSRD